MPAKLKQRFLGLGKRRRRKVPETKPQLNRKPVIPRRHGVDDLLKNYPDNVRFKRQGKNIVLTFNGKNIAVYDTNGKRLMVVGKNVEFDGKDFLILLNDAEKKKYGLV